MYTPPDCECKMNADAFCRGKGDDELTVDMLVVEGSILGDQQAALFGQTCFSQGEADKGC